MRLAVHLGTTVSQHLLRDAFASARSCTSGHLVESKKVNEKGGKDSLEQMHKKKEGENTRTEKHTENNKKGGKERVKRRFISSEEEFLFLKTFSKISKRDKSRNTKGFLKTLKKGGKENENKKKEKNREKLIKNKIGKRYKKREKTEKTITNTHQKRRKQRKKKRRQKQTNNGTYGK